MFKFLSRITLGYLFVDGIYGSVTWLGLQDMITNSSQLTARTKMFLISELLPVSWDEVLIEECKARNALNESNTSYLARDQEWIEATEENR